MGTIASEVVETLAQSMTVLPQGCTGCLCHRMDYARYRREGYFIGSGTIESACKQLATMRLKRSCARWTEEGALKTAKARATWLGDAWDEVTRPKRDLPLAA